MSLTVNIDNFRAGVRGTDLTGLSIPAGSPSTISATDTILQALAKLQNSINNVSGASYEIVAGVFRKTAGTWAFIEDAGHTKLHLSSLEENGNRLKVHYDKTYSKVISMIAVPDETLSLNGVILGCSVGTSFNEIYGFSPVSSARITSGASFSVVSSLGGGISAAAWNATNNCCRVTISNAFVQLNAYGISPISRSAKYRCIIRETSTTWTDVQFVDKDGVIATAYDNGEMGFDITIERPREINVNSATIQVAGSNIWMLGVMEV